MLSTLDEDYTFHDFLPAIPGLTLDLYQSSSGAAAFGRIEILTFDRVAGWILIKGESEPVVLMVYHNGRKLTEVTCTTRRQDLAELLGNHEAFGFDIAFDKLSGVTYVEMLRLTMIVHEPSRRFLPVDFANAVEYRDQGRQPRRIANFKPESDLKFSFVIPVYDRVQELRESINSCLNQTYQNFEIIIVGDNPPSDTMAVLDSFRSHPKIRIFTYPDRSGNACRGRNKGITMASGDVIALQDSDDIAFPNRLETASYIFRNAHYGGVHMLYSSVSALTDGSRRIEGIEFGQTIQAQLVPFERLIFDNPVFTCTACIRRDVLLLRGGFRREMTYREDHELWLRLAYHGAIFHVVPDPLALYRIHSGNAELTFLDRDAVWKERMLQLYNEESQFNWNT